MGKGFTVSAPTGKQVVYVDRETKRFVPPPEPRIVDDANAKGIQVLDYVQENQAPEHPTPGGKNHQAEERPPMRRADPARPPMRLKP